MSLDFSKFVRKFLAPISFSPSEIEFLRQLRFAGGKYTDFAKIVQENKEIEANLLEVANNDFTSRSNDPVTSAAVALSMIGFLPSRNFLAALMIKGNGTDLIPDDPSVSNVLHFALAGEAIGGTEGVLSSDYFVAGLVFDIITSILSDPSAPGDQSEYFSSIEDTWKHGVQVAGIACQLARILLPDLNLEKDLCVDGILHDIGKLAYFPGMSEEELETRRQQKFLPDQGWMREVEEYGFPHDVLGHLILWNLGFLSDSSWIVMYHHQPFLAARLGSTTHIRATLIWLADHVCRNREYHRKPRVSDQMIRNWFNASEAALNRCSFEKFRSALIKI